MTERATVNPGRTGPDSDSVGADCGGQAQGPGTSTGPGPAQPPSLPGARLCQPDGELPQTRTRTIHRDTGPRAGPGPRRLTQWPQAQSHWPRAWRPPSQRRAASQSSLRLLNSSLAISDSEFGTGTQPERPTRSPCSGRGGGGGGGEVAADESR